MRSGCIASWCTTASGIRANWAREIQAFLTWLAVERNVAASTQNQALCALLFLYRKVLRIDLPRVIQGCTTAAPVADHAFASMIVV
jgi:hypothetical protein